MKRTPLFESHQKLGGRIIEFGDWEMPVQYTSIVDEHQAVRQAAGLFDISHMGEVFVSGLDAAKFLNGLLTNDIAKLKPGQGQYTLMCNAKGGVIDDLYAYRLGAEMYLLIVNASRIAADFEWMRSEREKVPGEKVMVENRSETMGAVALQGPNSEKIMAAFFKDVRNATGATATELKKNEVGEFRHGENAIWISRTGYTGEDGFEIVAPNKDIELIWIRLLEVGREFGLKPAGLGARDTLRTEMCYPLYSHELNEETTPLEAGLGFFVQLEKEAFNGKEALARQKSEGLSKKLAAFKMAEKSAPPRPHYHVFGEGEGSPMLGEVTSGTQSPSLGAGIGMAFVPVETAKVGTPIAVESRGRRYPAVIAAKPLYRKAIDPSPRP